MTPALGTHTEGNKKNKTAGEEVQTGDLQSLYPIVYKYQSLSRFTKRQKKVSSLFCPEIGAKAMYTTIQFASHRVPSLLPLETPPVIEK